MTEQQLDLTEVKTLIDNLQFLEKQLSGAITNWKRDVKTCDWAIAHMSKGVLKRLCESPGILRGEIFGPLYSFLNTYIANREGRVAFTGKALDAHLNKGLRAIQQYTVISDFFARNPQYFVPNISISAGGLEASKKAITEQSKYKDFIFTVNERLIGCKDNLNFMFLKLLSTVKTMSDELKEMKDYLQQQCTSIRIARLKM